MVSTMLDLFKDPFFIGIDRELGRFQHASEVAAKQSYPPYDLIQLDEDHYKVTLAVAGFCKEDIEVTTKDGYLIVSGDQCLPEKDLTYLHKGIATRKFTRTFALGEYMEVCCAEMDNGLLHIEVKREIPEEKKPKQITIK